MNATPPLEGRLLAGRYRVLHLIGTGGMGAVYAGVQEDLQRRVALKVLHPSGRIEPAELARFRQEALAAADLSHPNIAQVTDFQAWPGEPPLLVMELLSGESLRTLLNREPILPSARAVFILTQILAALAAAHAAGIIHRDVKPANVFLTRTPAVADLVKVLDFGIAKYTRRPENFRTGPGTVLGTPAYMAPEQALGLEVDPRADLYAAGACLFEMLAGRRPYAGGTPGELLGRIVSERPPPLASVMPGIDPRLAAVVDRALSREPAARWSSALEMLDVLAPRSRSEPQLSAPREPAADDTTSMDAPRQPVAVSPARSRTDLVIGAAVSAVLVTTLGVLGYVYLEYRATHPATIAAPIPTMMPLTPDVARADYWMIERLTRPAVGDFVGDTTEDVAATVLHLANTDVRRLVVFDGRSGKLAWTSAPAPAGVLAYHHRVVAVGMRIVFIAENGLLRVYDAKTGREIRSVTVTDSIRQLCVPTDATSRGKVWVELDRSAHLLDVETGVLEDAAIAPDGCTATSHLRGTLSAGSANAPRREFSLGSASVTALYEDDLAVGALEDGLENKSFVGLEASTSEILWKLPRKDESNDNAVLELRDGRAYLARVRGSTGVVDCVDARTGSLVWTATLTGAPLHDVSSAVISPHRVYITVDAHIEIFALATGKRTGSIGYQR